MTDLDNNLTAIKHPANQVEEDGVDIWEYVRILRRRWPLILLCILVSVGISAFVTLRMTKIYRATATIRIETQAPQVLGKSVEDVVEMGTGSFWSNVEYYETQYQIIESRDVAKRVVIAFNLHEDKDFLNIPEEQRAEFKPVDLDTAAELFRSFVTVEPIKDSRLVKIHVDHPDPEKAMKYVNALAKAYRDRNLDSMRESTMEAVDWLADQKDDAGKKLAEAEQRLSEFKLKEAGQDIALFRTNILDEQAITAARNLEQSRDERIKFQSRKTAISKAMKSKDSLAISLTELNSNPLIQQLKQKHDELSQEYDELSQRYGENFPRMKELKAKIDRIRLDIDREVNNVLKAVNSELNAARSSEVGLNNRLNELRTHISKVSELDAEYTRINRDIKYAEESYSLLLGRSKEAELARSVKANNVEILDAALLPEFPIKPRLTVNLALALAIGLIFGIGLAVLIEFVDRTIKTQEDVEGLKITFLGIMPDIASSSTGGGSNYGKGSKSKIDVPVGDDGQVNPDLFVNEFPKSQVAESCRALRTNLLFMTTNKPNSRILVTSASPQEGKTTVATNLAIVMAQSGSKVLLIDTDMRRPRVHRAFGQKPRKGISTLVLGESTIEESVYKSDIPNLSVLMCGPTPPNPAELIHTERFAQVLDDLSKRYDRLIFDSPPIGVVTDAAILSKLVDGTVLIVKSLQTTRDSAKHAVSVLNDIGANILGGVLNNLDLRNRKYGQHYYHYYYKKYGEYYGESDGGGNSGSKIDDKAAG